MDWCHKFVVLGVVSIFVVENKRFGLAGRNFNLVLGAVVQGEVQKTVIGPSGLCALSRNVSTINGVF